MIRLPKDKAFTIRLSEGDKLLLQDTATKAGYESIAEFIRSMTNKKMIDTTIAKQSAMIMEIRQDVKKILKKLEE